MLCVCVYHETSAFGHKLVPGLPFLYSEFYWRQWACSGFPFNPELSLLGLLSTVISFFLFFFFFNKISDLGKKGKRCNLCCYFQMPLPRFYCHCSYCPCYLKQFSFQNHNLTTEASCLNSAPLESHIGKPDCFQERLLFCAKRNTRVYDLLAWRPGFLSVLIFEGNDRRRISYWNINANIEGLGFDWDFYYSP